MKSLQLTTEFGAAIVVRCLELGSSSIELSFEWGERDGCTAWMTHEQVALLVVAIGEVSGAPWASVGPPAILMRDAKKQGKIKEL